MKFRILIILIIFFSTNTKAAILNIGEVFDKEIKFHKSKFFLPYPPYTLTNHTVTEVNYGYNFEEFFLTNINNNDFISGVRILLGIKLEPTYWSYFGNYEVCDKSNVFYKVKKRSGYTFNCMGIFTGYLNDHAKLSDYIFAVAQGNSSSRMDNSINNLIKSKNLNEDLLIRSYHIYYSTYYMRHLAVEYIFNPKYFNEFEALDYHFMENSRLKNSLSYSDKKKLDKIVFFFNNLQKNFEENLKIKSNVSLLKKIKKNNASREINKPAKIVEELQKLNNLYKNGAITLDEFKKAKQKALK